jgi:hypothetical protein
VRVGGLGGVGGGGDANLWCVFFEMLMLTYPDVTGTTERWRKTSRKDPN